MHCCNAPHRSGFTLLELAIVLVIIGLVLGAILVGKNLITSAMIRADISKMQQISAAINAFEEKYDAIPGDITNLQASAFGFSGVGNGDDTLEDIWAEISYPYYWSLPQGETAYVFYQLSVTQLIAGNYSYTPGSSIVNWAPNLRSHKDFYFNLISTNIDDGLWFFVGLNGPPVTDGYAYWNATRDTLGNYKPVYTPAEAFLIDSKRDDGVPSSGKVLAIYVTVPVDGIDTRPGNCVVDATAAAYNIKNTNQMCDLLIRADE